MKFVTKKGMRLALVAVYGQPMRGRYRPRCQECRNKFQPKGRGGSE